MMESSEETLNYMSVALVKHLCLLCLGLVVVFALYVCSNPVILVLNICEVVFLLASVVSAL